MIKVYYSAVVIIPPEDTWLSIQQIRKQYDRNMHKWMPHITLIYPFRPESQFNALELQFAKACNSFKSILIELASFKAFHHGQNNHTILLLPTPADIIIELQKRLLTIVPDCDDVIKYENGFTPHLSVGQFHGSLRQLDELINVLQSLWSPIQFMWDRIQFIAREPRKTSKFQVLKEIYFNH
jgi:2'-5' RNA ligase